LYTKLLTTGSVDVVKDCRSYIGIEAPTCFSKAVFPCENTI